MKTPEIKIGSHQLNHFSSLELQTAMMNLSDSLKIRVNLAVGEVVPFSVGNKISLSWEPTEGNAFGFTGLVDSAETVIDTQSYYLEIIARGAPDIVDCFVANYCQYEHTPVQSILAHLAKNRCEIEASGSIPFFLVEPGSIASNIQKLSIYSAKVPFFKEGKLKLFDVPDAWVPQKIISDGYKNAKYMNDQKEVFSDYIASVNGIEEQARVTDENIKRDRPIVFPSTYLKEASNAFLNWQKTLRLAKSERLELTYALTDEVEHIPQIAECVAIEDKKLGVNYSMWLVFSHRLTVSPDNCPLVSLTLVRPNALKYNPVQQNFQKMGMWEAIRGEE